MAFIIVHNGYIWPACTIFLSFILFVMKYKHIIHVLFDIINIETAMLNETHRENENSFQLIFWAYSSCVYLCAQLLILMQLFIQFYVELLIKQN